MATHDDSSLGVPLEFKRKQQKKEELEREVSGLKKMLAHEQKVHEYLERIHDRKDDGWAISIPKFLPPKMKEIMSELAMVEKEIRRLERQINVLGDEVKREKEGNIDRKQRRPPPNDTKALHFITKPIKGDYHLTKQNNFHQPAPLLKHPSPLRDPRHPTPRTRDRNRYRGRNLDEYPSSKVVMSSPLHREEESMAMAMERWGANKLSENIMKCLMLIYVRLLRTSRVMEMEKSGSSIARSTNFSLSFRAADTTTTASTTTTTTTTTTMDSKPQQDPYGIFHSEVSISRDIGPYKNLVRFTSTSIHFKCIQNSTSLPLFHKLKMLMDGLQKVDLRFFTHQQKLAFWINMYNACIMHGYLQYGVPSVLNNDTLVALINKATLNIAGNTINARAIEHFILRKPEDSLIKEILGKDMIVGELYGLETPDPNIIFALCCGTRSSPAVKIYTAEGVTAELERSKLEYLQAAIMVTGAKKIGIPQLLLTNMSDFAADKESLLEWICHQLPTSGSLRKSIVDCFRGVHGGKGGASALVDKIPYDFDFQYLLPI
ncbi:hypothetical protein C2S53_014636 [Perilla frutescens var. hirtella]|uniref:DUF547 domain-containing protein n=1 Tax=Perilla frutescens var. hirtella TaxID=608512 RepID=A0AAD4J681_PERFH|nr:hypothetical protein C2S53_014636 [Perilla frutescens var. hirtella]